MIKRRAEIKRAHSLTGFAVGTLVNTAEGQKPIEQIRVGDELLSFPHNEPAPKHMRQKDEYIYRKVTTTTAHDVESLCEVEVLAFGDRIKEKLRVAAAHPFYVARHGWVAAEKLGGIGVLVNCVFGNLIASQVVVRREGFRAYNLEVDGLHTYYVGEASTWVHDGAVAL